MGKSVNSQVGGVIMKKRMLLVVFLYDVIGDSGWLFFGRL